MMMMMMMMMVHAKSTVERVANYVAPRVRVRKLFSGDRHPVSNLGRHENINEFSATQSVSMLQELA